jgi:hypothetical protein
MNLGQVCNFQGKPAKASFCRCSDLPGKNQPKPVSPELARRLLKPSQACFVCPSPVHLEFDANSFDLEGNLQILFWKFSY